MLRPATEYAERQTDRRRKIGRKIHIGSTVRRPTDIVFAQASKKYAVKYMISLTNKLRMYILGTVRTSLLHTIMIRMTILPVVPNIKGTA